MQKSYIMHGLMTVLGRSIALRLHSIEGVQDTLKIMRHILSQFEHGHIYI